MNTDKFAQELNENCLHKNCNFKLLWEPEYLEFENCIDLDIQRPYCYKSGGDAWYLCWSCRERIQRHPAFLQRKLDILMERLLNMNVESNCDDWNHKECPDCVNSNTNDY